MRVDRGAVPRETPVEGMGEPTTNSTSGGGGGGGAPNIV